MSDVDVHRIERGGEVIDLFSPDGLIDLLSWEDRAPIFPEKKKNIVFFRGEIDDMAFDPDDMSIFIDLDGGIARSWESYGWSLSFRDIFDTESELFEIAGFHEVVISSERESLDPVSLFPERGEKEKWYIDLSCSEHPHERESIDLGHHPVEYEKVETLTRDHIEGFGSIFRDLSRVSLRSEIEGDIVSDVGMIFGDEHMHGI